MIRTAGVATTGICGVLCGVALVTTSAEAGTALTTGEPPAGMWSGRGSRCVPFKDDPYNPGEDLVRMRVSVRMEKPAEKKKVSGKELNYKSFYAFRLQARLIPRGSAFAQNAGKAWKKSELDVREGFGARRAILTVETYSESTAAEWDIQVKLTWDRFGPDWVHEFRVKSAVPSKC